jgi:type IV secretion system protein VirD4
VSADRSHPDVGPASWEIPTATVLVWLTGAALVLPAGRAAAALLTGRGWPWPEGSTHLAAAIGGLLTGDPAAGLDAAQVAALPSSAAVYAVTAALGALFLAGSGGAAWAGHRWAGGRPGMASRGQVAEVLGRARLRRVAPVVRPDLRPTRRLLGLGPAPADRHGVGWRLGSAAVPAAGQLWVPFDRTTGVYGPQGSGKTLDLLAPHSSARPARPW